MNITNLSEQDRTQLQERGAQAGIEDNSLPAEQVLAWQNDEQERPGLFVP